MRNVLNMVWRSQEMENKRGEGPLYFLEDSECLPKRSEVPLSAETEQALHAVYCSRTKNNYDPNEIKKLEKILEHEPKK